MTRSCCDLFGDTPAAACLPELPQGPPRHLSPQQTQPGRGPGESKIGLLCASPWQLLDFRRFAACGPLAAMELVQEKVNAPPFGGCPQIAEFSCMVPGPARPTAAT